MSATSRQCELPGCELEIEPRAAGGHERRYCCASHRAAARRLRIEAAARQGEQRPARDVPTLSEPTPGALDHRRQPTAASDARDRRRAAVRRRRHAVAVLGAASILAGGGGLVALTQSSTGGSDVPRQSSIGLSPPATGQRWAEQARVTLASLDGQLDLIAQAEAAWRLTPSSRRAGTPPVAVLELLRKKTALEQVRATLESQLASWESFQSARTSLALTEGQLADIDKTLQATQTSTRESPDGRANTERLIAQRDVLLHQRDMQREQLLGWDRGIAQAASTPLPEVDDSASSVVEPVLALAESPQPQPAPLPDGTPRLLPAAPPPEDQTGWTRQDVGIGAPPQPGAPPSGGSGEDNRSPADHAQRVVLVAYTQAQADDRPTPRSKPQAKAPAARAAASKRATPKQRRAKKPASNAVPKAPKAPPRKPVKRTVAPPKPSAAKSAPCPSPRPRAT